MSLLEALEKNLGSNRFVLEMQDNSMMDLGILDGDHVVIQSCDTANNGQIVVVVVNGNESLLRRYFARDGRIELRPEHRPLLDAEFHQPENVRVIGRVVGIFRQY